MGYLKLSIYNKVVEVLFPRLIQHIWIRKEKKRHFILEILVMNYKYSSYVFMK